MASRGKPGDNVRGGFLGGTHSVRPRGKAIRKPRHYILTGWVDDKAVAKRAHASVKPRPSLRACGARPSAGRPTPTRLA